jgi:hypothetical protein
VALLLQALREVRVHSGDPDLVPPMIERSESAGHRKVLGRSDAMPAVVLHEAELMTVYQHWQPERNTAK